MISPALKALLAAIRAHEGGTYGRIYYGAKGVPKDTDVSKLTLNGVLALQQRMRDAGSASTACGGYQFLRKTLMATIAQMGLKGTELWDAALQDRMAIHLMKGRGLEMYLTDRMSRDDFCNNLAKEWASLPVVTKIKGQRRMVFPGETYYAGDDLNRALHKPEAILKLVEALKGTEMPAQPAPDAPAPMAPKPVPIPPVPQPAPPVVAAKLPWWKRWFWWG
jgi:muramidase (phage lysozyme)